MEDKIIKLLNKKKKIEINILRKISEKDVEYSIASLSEDLLISRRTTQRYVDDLQDYVNLYNEKIREEFRIFHYKKGVRLVINQRANINFLISFILQNDDTIQLLKYLFIQNYSSMKEYCQKEFINISTTQKMIRKINFFLNDYKLKVDSSNFNLEGSEVTIRLLMHNFLWLIHRCDEFPFVFNILDKTVIKNNIFYILENIGITSSNRVKIKDLEFRLCISLMRYQKKNYVDLNKQQRSYIPIYQNNHGKLTLYEIVEYVTNSHQIFDPKEIYFLIYSFFTNSLFYTVKPLKKQLFYHHVRLNTDVYRATKFFIDDFQKKIYTIPNSKLNDVYEFIFETHLIASIDKNGFNDYNSYIFDAVRLETPKLISQLDGIINDLQKEIQIINSNEHYYLINRYLILKYILNMNLLYKKPIAIILNTDFPEIYESFIKDYLTNLYQNKYKILFIENDFYQTCDLILTSYYFSEEDSDTINISYPLTDREIKILDIKFEEIDTRNNK